MKTEFKIYLRIVMFFVFFVSCYSGYSQDYSSHLQDGQSFLYRKDYKKAVKSLTSCIEIRNTSIAHFNRGIAYLNLKDTCSFCNDMVQAKYMNKNNVGDKFERFCFKSDTLENNSNEIFIKRTRKGTGLEDFIVYSKIDQDTVVYVVENGQKIYTYLKNCPLYPGGNDKFRDNLMINVEYPSQVQIDGAQGTVIAAALIDIKGKIADVEVITKRNPLLDKATVDVIKKIGTFTPARLQNGVPVTYRMIIPLTFIVE
jgi:hypothetical protein